MRYYLRLVLIATTSALAACQETPPAPKYLVLPTLIISDAPSVLEKDPDPLVKDAYAVFSVTLSEPTAKTVSFGYRTGFDTAGEQDFSSVYLPLSVDIPPGQTKTEIRIKITDDGEDEHDESLYVELVGAAYANLDAHQTRGRAVILDNDDPPWISLVNSGTASTPSLALENGGGVPLHFALLSPLNNAIKMKSGKNIVVKLGLSGASAADIALPAEVTIPAGQETYTFHLPLIDDITAGEAAQNVVLTLASATDATIDTLNNSVSFTLKDDDVVGTLNDTGATTCYDDLSAIPCGTSPGHAGQDADYVAALNVSTYSAPNGDSCLQDLTTGLMWEIKDDNSPLRRSGFTYSWYVDHDNINGGKLGGRRSYTSGAPCGVLEFCDSQSYLDAVNALNTDGLCGFKDWRLPKLHELLSLVDYSGGTSAAHIYANFGATLSGYYWAVAPSAAYIDRAWAVDFKTGNFFPWMKSRDDTAAIRLVRSMP